MAMHKSELRVWIENHPEASIEDIEDQFPKVQRYRIWNVRNNIQKAKNPPKTKPLPKKMEKMENMEISVNLQMSGLSVKMMVGTKTIGTLYLDQNQKLKLVKAKAKKIPQHSLPFNLITALQDAEIG